MMTSLNAPIGLLGGTFDPVHNGHLHLARTCIDTLGLAQVRFIPANLPPHRGAPLADPGQRLAMLERAVAGSETLAVETIELDRGGTSYTIDTVRALRDAWSNRPLALIMGMDAFQSLHTWRQWTSLLEYVHIIAAHRPGNESIIQNQDISRLCEKAASADASRLRQSPSGAILITSLPMLDISSTRIRERIAGGSDASGMLPGPVAEYIREEGLYRRGA